MVVDWLEWLASCCLMATTKPLTPFGPTNLVWPIWSDQLSSDCSMARRYIERSFDGGRVDWRGGRGEMGSVIIIVAPQTCKRAILNQVQLADLTKDILKGNF